MSKDRRHAAIMFTDIVGYTTLMGSDEDRAFEILGKNREIHTKLIVQFNGTLIKEMGDGMLISFSLASDAVRCAIEIQKACKEQIIPLKIGIHEGEMIFVGADVFGDGVNIASRIQNNAEGGRIFISNSVYQNIKNKTGIEAEFVEEMTFKNVDEPVWIYKVHYEGEDDENINKAIKVSQPRSKELEKSIAVLPFINDSPDKENEYFINGIGEAILDNLCKIEEIRVISRTSVEQYREHPKPTPVIADEMNVNYILEGSGQKYGNKVRLTLQLVDARNDKHLWSSPYNREIVIEDIFSLQSEIAELVGTEVEAIITPNEKHLIEKIPTANPKAYDAYLKGKFYLNNATSNNLDTAMHYFELSKDKDPEFALAYASIGIVWAFRQQLGFVTPDEGAPKMMAAIERALELDSKLAEAHNMMALISFVGMWDWKGAELSFKKAIAINPNLAEVHAVYSHLLNVTGRPKEAMEHIELALKLDPYNPMIKVWYSNDLVFVRRYDDAISVSREVLEMNPTMFMAFDALWPWFRAASPWMIFSPWPRNTRNTPR